MRMKKKREAKVRAKAKREGISYGAGIGGFDEIGDSLALN